MTIARSAILTHQQRLAVISHNIANVNTDGYHRQRVALGTNPAIPPTMLETRTWTIGTGVTVLDVIRTYNGMKEAVLRGQISDAVLHEEKGKALADVEALIVGIGDASLSERLLDFWNAWQDVANNADSLSFRSVLIERGAALTDHINTLDDRLTSYRTGVLAGAAGSYTGIVANEVAEINTMATEIANLNSRISSFNASYDAHDLMDRRNELIKELSEKVDIAVGADYEITIGGVVLVSGDGATINTLAIRDDLSGTETSGIEITLGPVGGPPDGVVAISSGSLRAWIDVAGIVDGSGTPLAVDSLREKLDEFALALINAVNALHATGYDLDGNLSSDNLITSGAFFDGNDASDIAVHDEIHHSTNPLLDNPRLIAAAGTLHDPGGPDEGPNVGDGANALDIAGLAHAQTVGIYTFEQYFSSMVGALGATVQTELNLAGDGEAIISMLINSIQAETGVSLDEEMIEMLSAQRAYEAAARLLTTIDDLMDLVINRMGA